MVSGFYKMTEGKKILDLLTVYDENILLDIQINLLDIKINQKITTLDQKKNFIKNLPIEKIGENHHKLADNLKNTIHSYIEKFLIDFNKYIEEKFSKQIPAIECIKKSCESKVVKINQKYKNLNNLLSKLDYETVQNKKNINFLLDKLSLLHKYSCENYHLNNK
jgi:hypothetical protein